MAGPQHQTRRRLINSAPSAAPRANAEQHQKTITVDDTTAAVGTGNLTPQYYSTSRDA
jgi:phosphatidylserine/phosphatidylglycerophosphate/cardiolipin synthase-like enzyme